MRTRVLLSVMLVAVLFCDMQSSFAVISEMQNVPEAPNVVGEAAVLADAKSGEILYEKNANDIKEMASTTKIMTALITIENIPLDTVITVDSEAAYIEGASINLQVGEEITVRELLYGLLLKSANDAAAALAKAVGGTMENFVNMMNLKAEELGLENTNFKNPHGLHDDGHYTSAADLAILSQKAMQNGVLREYAGTVTHAVPPTNMSPARNLKNINHLLFDKEKNIDVNGSMRSIKYDGAIGLKTGYTDEAKNCISAVAKRGEAEYIVTVLGSSKDGKYADSIALFDFAFANFSPVKIMDAKDGRDFDVRMGKKGSVKAVLREDVYITLPAGADKAKLQYSIDEIEKLEAPVAKGSHIADLNVYYEGKLVKKVEAYAQQGDEKGGILVFLRSIFILQSLAIIVGAGIFAVLVKAYNARKKRIKLQKEEEKKRKAFEMELERLRQNRQRFARYK